jgi:predicted transcriptional regulator
MSVGRFSFRLCRALVWLALAAALSASALPGTEPTVEELKARLSSTSVGDRPHLCVQIAEQQLTAADKLYAGAEVEKAQTALTDVVAYSELARDYAIQSHKREKQTEIAVRGMMRKLTEIVHSLAQADQPPVRDAINRLQHVRDDLLAAMFPKGAK